jgi:uncharacterized protein
LLVDAFLDGHFEVVASPHLVAELAGVLNRPKFSRYAADGRADAFIAALVDQMTMVGNVAPEVGATADPDDDYLVALGRAHRVDAIVSGDRHLLDAATELLRVWSPRECADRLGLTGDAS